MFGILNIKKHLKENRQVYFYATVIVFLGFLIGAFYSNFVSMDNFESYSLVLSEYIKSSGEALGINPNNSDVFNLVMIFFWSFFLFGKPFSAFFAFKSGFSVGFYISFFVKVYSIRGFIAGLLILFLYLVFISVPVILLTAQSFTTNMYLTSSVFGKNKIPEKNQFGRKFFLYLSLFLGCILVTVFGNFISFFVIPEILDVLF